MSPARLAGMRAAVLAFSLIALASTRALAADDDDDATPFESRPTAIYAVLGLGTPVGFLGAEVEQTLLPHWTVTAGGGFGTGGPQGSVMMHLLGGGQRSKLTLGAGISGGKYAWEEWCLDCDGGARKTGTVAWGNV